MEQEWEATLVNSNHIVNIISLLPGTQQSCMLLFLVRFCNVFYAVTPIHFPTPVSSLLSNCESTVGNNFLSFIFCLTWGGQMIFFVFSNLRLKQNFYHYTYWQAAIDCELWIVIDLNTDLSGTLGGTMGGLMLDPASEIRGGLGGGWTLSVMS